MRCSDGFTPDFVSTSFFKARIFVCSFARRRKESQSQKVNFFFAVFAMMRKRRRRRKKSKTTNLGRAIWDRSPRATKAIASEKRELRSDAETASFSRKRVSISELLRALSRSMKRNGNLSTKRYDRTSSLGKSQPYNKRRERERVMGRTQKKKHKKRSYRLAHGKLVLPDRVLRADFDRQRVLVRGGHPFFFFISLCLWLFFKNQTRFLLCLRFCPHTATRVSLQEHGK